MLVGHSGASPDVDPTAGVAPNAVVSGALLLSRDCERVGDSPADAWNGRNAVVRAAADLTPAFRGGASVGRAEPPDHEPLSLQRARQPIRRLRLLRAAPRRIQGGSTASTRSSRSRALCPRIIAAVQSGPVTDAHHVVASYWSAVISCAPLVRQSDQHTAKCSSDVATLRRRIPGPRRGRIKHRTDVRTGRVTGLVPSRRPSRIGANIGF
jgi:hypothetical protein